MKPIPLLVASEDWVSLAGTTLDRAAVRHCDQQRVLQLLADAADAGHVTLGPDAESELRSRLRERAVVAVTLDSRLLATVDALGSAGLDLRLLKGAAVARLDYESPAQRPYGDVDLLVRGEDIGCAVRVVEEAGFRRHFNEPFPGHDRTFGKGVALRGPAGVEVDLHRTLALGYYGTRLPVDDLWTRSDAVDVHGLTIPALARPERFLHSALHSALSPTPRLSDSIDLARIWRGGSGTALQCEEIVEEARRWGCASRVAAAVRRANSLLPNRFDDMLVEWAELTGRRMTEWLVDQTYDGPIAASRARTASAVVGLRGWRDRIDATTGLLRRSRDG